MKFNFIEDKKMENLYDYFLHYNIYTKEWNAILRNESNKYLNGKYGSGFDSTVVVFTDTDINKLIEKVN
jgi:hypothetical protein